MLLRHTLLPLLGALFFFTGCAPTYPCGDTQCGEDQYCRVGCGVVGGQGYDCSDLPDGCSDCDCITVSDPATCEMVDGHPVVSLNVGCL